MNKIFLILSLFLFFSKLQVNCQNTINSVYIKQEKDTNSFLEKTQYKESFLKKSVYNSSHYNIKKAEIELEKFLFFEKKFKNSSRKTYLHQISSYSKDSLQILAIKLLSIKKLYKKELLTKDVSLNKQYYNSILDELKQSNIVSEEYLFLEKELLQFKVKKTESNYVFSKQVNFGLIFIIILLLVFLVFNRRKKQKISDIVLSKQETTIKNLIIEGKTNKEIANELFISLSTVKTHITNIYQKLEVVNRKELTLKFKNNTGTST